MGTLRRDLRGVFGIRFVDEETRGASEVERVSAAGVVGCDQGRDSLRGESRVRELCVRSHGVGADLDYLGLRWRPS
jgi:hypothetical protein